MDAFARPRIPACSLVRDLVQWRTTEREIYDGVIMNGTTDFAFVVETLRRHEARWCVIGGLAVNTYAEPVYTADVALVVVAGELEAVLSDLRAADFRIKEFPFSINAQRRGSRADGRPVSRLLVQFTRPERYQSFVDRAVLRPVFGLDVPVAALEDVVQGKLWAWSDPTRRESKRSKDESDLLRLAESHSEIQEMLPAPLRQRLENQRTPGSLVDEDLWDE